MPVPNLSSLEEIARLYAAHGGQGYGEHVTQLEHALQCAVLAQEHHAPPSLVAAALLHDIGHFFEPEGDATAIDDRHQLVGARALSGVFGDDVCQPVALHVAAKRYLCFTEPQYYAGLSAASRNSLRLQGGIFDMPQAQAFERQPFWQDAVTLRRFDDMGKRDDLSSRSFADFAPLLQSLRPGGA